MTYRYPGQAARHTHPLDPEGLFEDQAGEGEEECEGPELSEESVPEKWEPE